MTAPAIPKGGEFTGVPCNHSAGHRRACVGDLNGDGRPPSGTSSCARPTFPATARPTQPTWRFGSASGGLK